MSRFAIGVALTLLLLLSLLVSAPARLLNWVLPGDQVLMQGFAGTLWRGSASRCLVQVSDALDEEAAARGVAEAAAAFGSVDAALLNIGEGPSFNMATASAAAVRENMRINYDTMVNYLVPLIAQMRSQGHGLIAHTNSLAGFLGLPMQGPYSACAHAIHTSPPRGALPGPGPGPGAPAREGSVLGGLDPPGLRA